VRDRWWQKPAVYYITRGGRIIRRPHEDFKLAELEYALLKHFKKETA
jgi:hypothetical protein